MMTSRERIGRILRRKKTDRVGLFEVFWGPTAQSWVDAGHFARPEEAEDHFNIELRRTSGNVTPLATLLDLSANPGVTEVVEETAEWRLVRDGNGALLRSPKSGIGGVEHVDFLVKDRAAWEEHIRPRIADRGLYRQRINVELYRKWRNHCRKHDLFLSCGVAGAFDSMNLVCGHEYTLMGMGLDPDWSTAMMDAYATANIEMMETLFAAEGEPDGVWIWDDLGFKNGPFMSPAMYRELVMPYHKRVIDFAHSRKLPVILHCDGFVESLIPSLIEAGVDCLQPLEAKAGMDLVRIKRQFGDRLSFCGGMDARALLTNDLAVVRAELEEKLPAAMAGGGYILQADHSVPLGVKYETYKYFVEKGLEMGTYK
jgi:uroporphyrinogen decarboxylase